MREIKFRVYHPTQFDDNDNPTRFEMSYDWAFEEYEPINDLLNSFEKPWAIMQYTGLKDKDGKEVYEKDIIKCVTTGLLGVVGWNEALAMFELVIVTEPYAGGSVSLYSGMIDGRNVMREVVGNVFETPTMAAKFDDGEVIELPLIITKDQ